MDSEIQKIISNIQNILLIKKYDDLKVVLEKDNINKNEIKKYANKRNKLLNLIKDSEKEKNIFFKSREKFKNLDSELEKSLFDVFTDDENFYKLYLDINNNSIKDKNIYKNIVFGKKNWTKLIYKYDSTYNQSNNEINEKIKNLPELYLKMETNGNLLIYFYYPTPSLKLFLYLLTILFNEVYLIGRNIIFCKKFKNLINDLKTITEIIQNNYIYKFNKKIDYKYIDDYFKPLLEYDIYVKNLLLYHNNKELYLSNELNIINFIKSLRLNKSDKIKKIVEEKIKDINNYSRKGDIKKVDVKLLKNTIEKEDTYNNNFLLNNIIDNDFKDLTLIGENNYLYNYVLNNKKINLTIIKNETSKLNNFNKILGIKDKKSKNIKIIKNNNSENILTKYFCDKKEIECIIINDIFENNTFNTLLLLVLLVEKILIKNGLIFIFNTQFNEINKCINHIENSVKSLKKINNTGNVIIFKKN